MKGSHFVRAIVWCWLVCAAVTLRAGPPAPAASQADVRDAKQPSDFDGPAELPRVRMETSMHDTPAPGKTIQVRAGQDPSEAVARASCGDTVELQAGATFGKLVLPPKKCDDSHWIIIRTSTPDLKLPAEGTRMVPCYGGVGALPGRVAFRCPASENVLAKLEFDGKGGSGPVIISSGASHYRLIGLEVTRAVSSAVVYNLIGPEKGPADHVIFDRLWIHGTAQNETVRGVMLSHIRYGAVIDSYLSDFHCVAKTGGCVDSQAIAGGSGDDPMGPFKIVNNFLEAAAESIELGGSGATTTPTDIEIRHNHMFKPLIWMKGQPGFVGGLDGNPFIVKNLFELKNAQRVLFEANVLEDTWGGFSQAGFAVLLTPKNQAIGQLNVCPICQVTDITIRYCTISHVAGGFQIGNGLSSNGGAAKDGGRYSIHDVTVDDIQPELYNGRGIFAQISSAPGVTQMVPLHDVNIDHVTAFPPRILFNIGGPVAEPKMSRISITNSIFLASERPVTTTGDGVDRNCSAGPMSRSLDLALHSCFSSYNFQNNVIIGGGGGWPKGTFTPSKLADVEFVSPKNGNGGEYRLAATSKFKRTASDGKDVGADIDAIERATKGVR
jgi:hypothetical protein